MEPLGEKVNGPAAASRPFRLGVLFVHGIGNQQQGSTLSEFGTPLVEWLESRAEQAGQAVLMGPAVLAPPSDTPAHSEFAFIGGAEAWRVMFAESWWAESFPIARFRDVAIWSLLITPWTVGTHFAKRARPGSRRSITVVYGFLVLVAALLASPLVLLALSCLLVLSWIPLGVVRDAIASMQYAIAGWIGDCYMLVVRPIEAAAIRSRVDRDLDWLTSRCEKVAVVAHSQGGAIACQVLERRSARDQLLITFGSGFRKLEELAAARSDRDLLRGALWTVVGLMVTALAVIAIPYVVYQATEGAASWLGAAVLLLPAAVGAAVSIAGIYDFSRSVRPTLGLKLASLFKFRNMQWEDIYASADPVPNGALRDDGQTPPTSHSIVNTGSVLRDHTSYWDNRDEFVPLVGEAILAFEGSTRLGPPKSTFLQFCRVQRAARVAMRRSIGWLTMLSAIALILVERTAWLQIAAWASQRLLKNIGGLFGFSPEVIAVPSTADWSDAVGRLALSLLFAWLTATLWNRWNSDAMRDTWAGTYQRREPYAVLTALIVQLAVTTALITSTDRAVIIGIGGMLVTLVAWAAAGGFQRPTAQVPTEGPQQSNSGALVVRNALAKLGAAAVETLILLAFSLWLAMRAYTYLATNFSAGAAWVAATVVILLGAWLSWKTAMS